MFLSASKVTVSPALTACFLTVPPFSPSFVFDAIAFQAALFTAFTTVSTVAILPASLVLTATVPALSPESTGLIVPVLTFKPLSSVVRVLSAAFTLTPSFVTSKDLSAGLTEIVFPVGSFCKPLPVLTLYLIVLVLPAVFSTDTVVPSPSTKLTVS